MKKLTMKQIEQATGGRLLCGSGAAEIDHVCRDSREADAGCLFFALIGENRDAHEYLDQAAAAGCTCAVISEEDACPQTEGFSAVLVEDTTRALQQLAKWYLQQLDIKKIAVTGSTGKTSTRDLTWQVCAGKYKTQKNIKNYNNHIGVPLTILALEEDTQVAVIEMGMDRPGEIDFLAELVRPHIGLITNIGTAHIEHLGSREAIFQAKMELTNYFDESSVLITARDEEFLNEERISGPYRLLTAGTDGRSDYILSAIDDFGADGIQFTLEYAGQTQRFRLPVPGRHNAFNAALAVAAGMEAGVAMEEAARQLARAELTEKRLTVRGYKGMKIIDDTYNAGPDSMKAAVDVLMKTKGIRSVAILGDIMELGEISRREHEQIGRYVAAKGVELLVTVGDQARYIASGAQEAGMKNVHHFPRKQAFLKKLSELVGKGDVILVKGSRGMEMEKIVKKIMEL